MVPAPPPLPRVEHLARQIERDIRERELPPESPYLTAAEVGRLFGVHSRMAHRAMNLLAARQLLVRRRGAGTVIGPAVAAATARGVVHVLMPAQRFDRVVEESNSPSALLAAIRRHLPSVSVQFDILPGAGTATDARAALALTLDGALAAGAVLIGCGREIQEYVQSTGVPTVVFGGTFATTAGLASVDADQTLLGQLLATHLLRRGHRKIAVLMHETWLPGDNAFFEAISETLTPSRAVCVVRSLPLDPVVFRAEVAPLVTNDSVTAVICRTRRRYDLLCDCLRDATPQVGSGAELVFDDAECRGPDVAAYACIAEPITAQVERVAALLTSVAQGAPAQRIVLPVQLVASAESAAIAAKPSRQSGEKSGRPAKTSRPRRTSVPSRKSPPR